MDDYRIRVRLFTGIIVVVLGILGLRLVQLQILNTEEYTGESRQNAIRERRVQPARGAIYDRTGRLLVDNEPTYTVMVTPRYFNEERAGLLADLLSVPDSVVTERLKAARAWSGFRPSPAFREVPFEALSRLQENQYLLPGVTYEVEEKRRYRTKAKAAHAFGYVREITKGELRSRRDEGYQPGDRIGKAGLEKMYEPMLRGRQGSEFQLVNIRGLPVKRYRDGEEDAPPLSGFDLHVGIDTEVQALAESLFVNKRGAAVALDPQSGEIIALVSMPDYDPEVFSKSIDPETWDYLNNSPQKPMFNRATQMGLPPGSTWKPFMSLMALQEGIITEGQKLPCPGAYYLGRHAFRNHGSRAYGNINVEKALEVSCNTFYYRLMMETDVDTWADYAHAFGFGQKMPTDLLEQSPGIIADSAYYNRHFGKGRWTAGYTINLGIGQGDMVVTPMQLARYTAAVANEGTLYAPHLVTKLHNPETGETLYPALPAPEKLPIDKAHFAPVKRGMQRVMENGTGYWAQIPGIPSGGKTGTAQNPHGKDHSIFIMFAPLEEPEIAIAVMVENAGYGGSAAAPIASLMAEQYLKGELSDTRETTVRLRRALSAESAPIQVGGE